MSVWKNKLSKCIFPLEFDYQDGNAIEDEHYFRQAVTYL
jgi:hypothetical protein